MITVEEIYIPVVAFLIQIINGLFIHEIGHYIVLKYGFKEKEAQIKYVPSIKLGAMAYVSPWTKPYSKDCCPKKLFLFATSGILAQLTFSFLIFISLFFFFHHNSYVDFFLVCFFIVNICDILCQVLLRKKVIEVNEEIQKKLGISTSKVYSDFQIIRRSDNYALIRAFIIGLILIFSIMGIIAIQSWYNL